MSYAKRRPLQCGVILLSLSLAACGGGGGGGVVPSTASTPQSIVSVNGDNVDFTGTIDSVSSSSFGIQVGSGAGHNTVKTTSSTVYVGAKPFVGESVEVVGTGSFSVSNSIVATKVMQLGASPSPSPTPAQVITPAPIATAPVLVATPAPLGSPIPIPSGVRAYGGPIVQMYSTGFSFYAGSNYGNMHENTQSTTTFVGPAPAVGSYAYITGPGTPGYYVNGSLVTITSGAPSSATVSGTVVAATTYGFTLNTGAANALPIGLTSSTVVGGAPLTAGSQVTVNGIGSASTSVVAVQIVVSAPTPPPGAIATPTPGPIAMTHVPTGDYLAGLYGTTAVSAAQAAPYLTWAQTDYRSANTISAAGIKTQLYVDPNREASTDPMWGYSYQTESDFAHDCSGSRITFNNTAGRYVMDPQSATLQQHFAQYVSSQTAKAHFDAVFEDNAGPLGPDQAYAAFSPSLPCGYSDAAWTAGGQTLDQAAPIPVIVNGINVPNGHDVSLTAQLYASSNTVGGNFEGCYDDVNKLKQTDWFWQTTENTELQTLAQGKLFVCMLRNQGAASSNTDARIYGYASYLLTYDPNNSVFWEEFQTPSGFHVEPESQLVPRDPLVPAPASITALQVGTNVFGREYAHCYIAGRFVSACAVVVNSDGYYSHTFPYPQYTHTLVLSGGGILDGGTMATNGPPPPQSIGPGEAVIAFP
jgi:hypothetical protein